VLVTVMVVARARIATAQSSTTAIAVDLMADIPMQSERSAPKRNTGKVTPLLLCDSAFHLRFLVGGVTWLLQ